MKLNEELLATRIIIKTILNQSNHDYFETAYNSRLNENGNKKEIDRLNRIKKNAYSSVSAATGRTKEYQWITSRSSFDEAMDILLYDIDRHLKVLNKGKGKSAIFASLVCGIVTNCDFILSKILIKNENDYLRILDNHNENNGDIGSVEQSLSYCIYRRIRKRAENKKLCNSNVIKGKVSDILDDVRLITNAGHDGQFLISLKQKICNAAIQYTVSLSSSGEKTAIKKCNRAFGELVEVSIANNRVNTKNTEKLDRMGINELIDYINNTLPHKFAQILKFSFSGVTRSRATLKDQMFELSASYARMTHEIKQSGNIKIEYTSTTTCEDRKKAYRLVREFYKKVTEAEKYLTLTSSNIDKLKDYGLDDNPKVIDNKFITDALISAINYLDNLDKKGTAWRHAHGVNATKEYIKKLLSLNHNSNRDTVIRLAQGWIGKEKGVFSYSSNLSNNSRTRYAYDSGVFKFDNNLAFDTLSNGNKTSIKKVILEGDPERNANSKKTYVFDLDQTLFSTEDSQNRINKVDKEISNFIIYNGMHGKCQVLNPKRTKAVMQCILAGGHQIAFATSGLAKKEDIKRFFRYVYQIPLGDDFHYYNGATDKTSCLTKIAVLDNRDFDDVVLIDNSGFHISCARNAGFSTVYVDNNESDSSNGEMYIQELEIMVGGQAIMQRALGF